MAPSMSISRLSELFLRLSIPTQLMILNSSRRSIYVLRTVLFLLSLSIQSIKAEELSLSFHPLE